MRAHTRVDASVEKPGRLQLAILEWQRQLVQARERLAAEQTRPPQLYPDCEVPLL
jgi:hypothetical protein